MRFKNYNDIYIAKTLKNCLKIKSGKDKKQVECLNGRYKIYGTGGVIGTTNTYLYDKESVGIGRKGTIDKPFYFDEPFWTVDTLFYSEINGGYVPKYIYYLFQTIKWKKYNTSTGVPSLTSTTIESIEKHFPSFEEQCKIARFLSLIDERIDAQIKIIDKYESLEMQIKDTLLWQNVVGKKVKLSSILTEINEKSNIQNQFSILSSTVKGLFLQSEYFEKEIASLNNIGYKVVHKGNVIISPQNLWMGNINYNDKFDNGLVSPSYKIFEINSNYNSNYIANLLRTYRALYLYKCVSEQGASVVRRNLNLDAFYELTFTIPSIEYQNKASNILDRLNHKVCNEKRHLVQLNKQKQFLLNTLFI